jgi:hypothetical protein
MSVVKFIPTIAKAVVAGIGTIAANEATIEAIAASSHVVPAGGLHLLSVGLGVIVGAATWLTKNKKLVDGAEKILADVIKELGDEADIPPLPNPAPAATPAQHTAIVVNADTTVSDAIAQYKKHHPHTQ